MPESTAKETRLVVAASNLTVNLIAKLAWIEDLKSFVKAPPGVSIPHLVCDFFVHARYIQAFDSVVPSERTRIKLSLDDVSIQVIAHPQSGALVLHLKGFDFATNVIGNLPDLSFTISMPNASLLFIDDLSTLLEVPDKSIIASSTMSYWQVSVCEVTCIDAHTFAG